MDDFEWTNWIDHDGKGYPHSIAKQMAENGYFTMQRRSRGPGRTETPWEQANRPKADASNPGWTWKRSGWFGRGDWIASDPAYNMFMQYRFGRRKPKSKQVEALREIVSKPDQPFDDAPDPEVPSKVSQN